MKTKLQAAVLCAGLLLAGPFHVRTVAAEAGSQTPSLPGSSPALSETARIARAAQNFLDSLETPQQAKVHFPFGDKEQRARWSNLPVRMVPRGGLRMGDLTPAQRTAVMTLLSVTLSKMGYEKVVGIIEADEVLNKNGGGRGGPFGRDEFYLSFLGKPSATAPWMLQFGGHHLALNVTFVGEADVMTPSLIAVQPARYTLEGRTVRPLGRETDKAFELVNSLEPAQRKKAILDSRCGTWFWDRATIVKPSSRKVFKRRP